MKTEAVQDNIEVQARMLIDVLGMFHGGDPNGVKRGDIVTLPEADALR